MKNINFHKKYKLFLSLLLLAPASLFAEPPKVSDVSDPLIQILLGVVVALAICIILLANVLLSAAQVHLKKFKETEKNNQSNVTKVVALLALMLISSGVFAADGASNAVVVNDTISGIKPSSFYALIGTIVVELTAIFFLLANLKFILKAETIAMINTPDVKVVKENKLLKWWEDLNSFKPIKEETQIDLGHNYDGIRELDNNLPGWWIYGFYLCILFACIYLWRFHVSHTGLSSKEELQVALDQGEKDKENYLKNAANNIDETTVKYLDAVADLDAGKTLFLANCVACHGEAANGLVNGNPGAGPNLTDDYWLHKGSMQDIFKTLKYGWPEKGMKSWKDDFSPTKMAQLASYIKSMHGKSAKGKDPQGELYQDAASSPTKDTTQPNKPIVDSVTKDSKKEVK